jgi:hypothetical protein
MILTQTKSGKTKLKIPRMKSGQSIEDYFSIVSNRIQQETTAKHGTLKMYLLGDRCESCCLAFRRSKQIPKAKEFLKEEFGITDKEAKQFLNQNVHNDFHTKYIDVWELEPKKFKLLAFSRFGSFETRPIS